MQVQATSREAYRRISKAQVMRESIMSFIRERGAVGSTCDEAQEALGLLAQTASARFTELAREGRIVSGHAKRPTRAGCGALVWVAKL